MKLAVAQTQPRRGDIAHNIADHMRFIQAAVAQYADLLIFPELSLTGYEPTLARALATTPDDPRLAPFQMCSDADRIVIGVGLPLVMGAGVGIGMVLFRPGQPRLVYAKHHLHPAFGFVAAGVVPALFAIVVGLPSLAAIRGAGVATEARRIKGDLDNLGHGMTEAVTQACRDTGGLGGVIDTVYSDINGERFGVLAITLPLAE